MNTSLQVEFRVPISANPQFLRMLLFLMQSIKTSGGTIANRANFVVSVSRDIPYFNIFEKFPQFKHFPVEFRWMDQALFDQLEYDGTGLDRFFVNSNPDIVISCDADILVTGDLDSLIIRCYEQQSELGFIAHSSPFCHPRFAPKTADSWWNDIYQEAKLPLPDLSMYHTGVNDSEAHKKDPSLLKCPIYYNYGFILSPIRHVNLIATTYENDINNVNRVTETWVKSQIALSMSYTRHAIACDTFSLNYNYPLHVNEKEFRAVNGALGEGFASTDIRVYHYLGMGEINKTDFHTMESLHLAMQRTGLSDSGVNFQEKLITIHSTLKDKNLLF